MQTAFKLPSCIQYVPIWGALTIQDKWDMVVICYRRISESCFHTPSIPITGFPCVGGVGCSRSSSISRPTSSSQRVHTTADGSYQRLSYTVAGGVLFQLQTCTTAGTRSIVTLLPHSDALHGNDPHPHCRRSYEGVYRAHTNYIIKEQGTQVLR